VHEIRTILEVLQRGINQRCCGSFHTNGKVELQKSRPETKLQKLCKASPQRKSPDFSGLFWAQ
jgi:hypothetical protein